MKERKLSMMLNEWPKGPLFALWTFETASYHMENCGSYSEAVELWQRTVYGSMGFRAKVVREFQQAKKRHDYVTGKVGSAWIALQENFQKWNNSATLLALTPASGDLTAIRSIMTLFLGHVAQCIQHRTSSIAKTIALEFIRSHAMKLKLPDNSMLDRCQTVFDWKVVNNNPLQGWKPPHYKLGNFLQAWQCTPIPSKEGRDSSLFIIRYDTKDIPLEYVVLRNDRFLFKRGPSLAMEHAAEKTYQYWFEMITQEKCKAALEPRPGRTIVVFGTWVADDVVLNTPEVFRTRIYPGSDTRDNLTFVHGPGTDKLEAKVVKILKPRASTPIEHELLLESGFTVKTSLDWRVKHPQQYIEGEVMCKQCECIDTITHGDYRYVHGFGLVCGVCHDYLIDVKELITQDMLDG
jgi:hypothetical protein